MTNHARVFLAGLTLMACSGALAAGPKLTPLPTLAGSATVGYKFINNSGAVAGEQGNYRTFGWSRSQGLVDMYPSGPGTPTLAGTWVEDLNASGQLLGTGCIPPPGGNGACGTYLYRAEAGQPHTPLDFTSLGGVFAQPGYLTRPRMSERGSVGAEFRLLSGGGSRVIVYTDAGGWHDLGALFPAGAYLQFVDINAEDTVLVQHATTMYLWTEVGGLAPVPAPAGAHARAMNDAGEITGTVAATGGFRPFRWGPQRGWELLGDPQRFPNAAPEFINNAGMVVGEYSGGTFVYSDGAGMVDVGQVGHVVGLNARGDVVGMAHDPTSYAGIPWIKEVDRPAQLLQDYVDPSRQQIVATGVTTINDSGAFAVIGRPPISAFASIAFLVEPEACAADFDGSGTLEIADIFAFLNGWFGGSSRADADASGELGVADIFAYLNSWFVGC